MTLGPPCIRLSEASQVPADMVCRVWLLKDQVRALGIKKMGHLKSATLLGDGSEIRLTN